MKRDEVAIYIQDITDADTDSLMNKYGLSFDKERLMRISKCQNAKGRQKLVATGAALVEVLRKYSLEVGNMAYAEYGKPFIINNDSVHFNLSHSGAYLVIAVAGQPVGVDIQKQVDYKDKVVDIICNREEAESVRTQFKDCFNCVWSYKEAAAKLSGDGLVNGMNRFVMDYSKKDSEILFKGQPYGFVKKVDFYDDYALAVACKEPFKIVQTAILEEV